jgi:hypothetical protein
MRRFGVLFVALAAMLALTTGSVLATGTLDQAQTSTIATKEWGSGFPLAQTFTAGATGVLDTVSVNMFIPAVLNVQPAAAGDFTVEIWATTSGLPSGASALATSTALTGGGWVDAAFTSPTSVVSGTMYAIKLVHPTGVIDWTGDCQTDNYVPGQALVFDVSWQTVPAWGIANDTGAACMLDFAFRTFVTPNATPAPSSTPAPTATPPPTATSTSATPENHSGAPVLLLFAGMATAAAFVAIRRYGLVRR